MNLISKAIVDAKRNGEFDVKTQGFAFFTQVGDVVSTSWLFPRDEGKFALADLFLEAQGALSVLEQTEVPFARIAFNRGEITGWRTRNLEGGLDTEALGIVEDFPWNRQDVFIFQGYQDAQAKDNA